jgi:nucleoside-diphosphate-sugar epimerase
LKTVSLRPHLIWGPDDPHLVPRIINRAKTGRLRLVGNKNNKVDSCYIDNAAQAHLLAADCLQSSGICAGKVYFISNDEPLSMADLINKILTVANLPVVNKTISANVAYLIGSILEKTYSVLNIKNEPIMTRFVARQLSTSHWFDLTAAKQDLSYQPVVSIDEGMQSLKESLSN